MGVIFIFHCSLPGVEGHLEKLPLMRVREIDLPGQEKPIFFLYLDYKVKKVPLKAEDRIFRRQIRDIAACKSHAYLIKDDVLQVRYLVVR